MLAPDEVRVAVDAVGLNFWDIFRAMGLFQEGLFGEELVGRIVEVGDDVGNVAVGDRVVGLGDGTFGTEAVTHAALVVPAPSGVSTTALATVPSVFVSAALAFEAADLKAGDWVLIHAGAGGLGLAAIELARAAGAEVIATASAPKRDFLRSLGIAHVFDSRTTEFGERVLEATNGAGVDVIVNSLTGEGFIAASLACLAEGGRFVELARRDIWTADEMAAARPDVGYSVIELDVCKRDEPERAGAILARVVECISAGEINPLVHCRWPLAAGRDRFGHGVHAVGAPYREDRADAAADVRRVAKPGSNVSRHRRLGRHRLRGGGLARRSRGRRDRAERPPRA
ncbi:MAG: zinc-binding dehydrogenase [Gammaproteobacteria bacterium]|nr:zinc-binding dehydrogenase [Gammaproteobacteria bacterium]